MESFPFQMEEKTIMHYHSTHKILLVGEGDFSFSLCLAKAFGTAVNMVATSLDSRVSLAQKYSHALSNVTSLEVLGCTILHQVNVHTMNDDPRLKYKKFDRIIFNFPHVGFFYAEREALQIWLNNNKKLVSGFLGNAKLMLNINGEIHITHKTTRPFTDWDIKELASRENLNFVGEAIFSKWFYPGYFSKRGSGSKCNLKFPIGKSSTFKFMAPKEAQVNYKQDEYEDEYLRMGPTIEAKRNRVWPKWLGDLVSTHKTFHLEMEEKRIMHYSSTHKILLVGEGDFSFSLCLAKAFGTAVNMVATSLDDRVSLQYKYSNALSNLTELEGLGCTIVHEVDVHTMTQHPTLKNNKFDRIIYNFPHVGFDRPESNHLQIQLNKKLVSGFLGNAKHMLNINGEIHITHKTTHPFTKWDIKELASQENLDFVGESIFRKRFYPGYLNKRGSSSRCDQSFPIGKSSTFKFTIVIDPEEAQANYEQEEEYEEEYLSKEPKIRAIVMDREEALANYEQEEYQEEYLIKGPKIQAIVMDSKEAQANYEHEEEYEEEYLIKGPKIRATVMDPREAQANYEQEEYEEKYLSKGPKIWPKQNRVWPKWLRAFFRCLCGY